MDIKIFPSVLHGTVEAVPSKSEAHRLLICSALADRETKLQLNSVSQDIEATMSCLSGLGAEPQIDGKYITVKPAQKNQGNQGRAFFDCAESGSTLRFILPVAAACGIDGYFCGRGRLPDRPISELAGVLEEHGISFSSHNIPFNISGNLSGGEYRISGDVSSQYITGLMLALPLINEKSLITLTTKLESKPYVDITMGCLAKFGVVINNIENGYEITYQRYISPGNVRPGGDWSNVSVFFAAGSAGGEVAVSGLELDSLQGDAALCGIMRRLGANVGSAEGYVAVRGGRLSGCEIDIADTPDLLPALAVVASAADGETRFYNGTRLRLKESDRISSSAAMINALGGFAKETEDGIYIRGTGLSSGIVDSCGDHRIVMAAAAASCFCTGPVVIHGAEAVRKSYPSFFEDFKKLGGKYDVI